MMEMLEWLGRKTLGIFDQLGAIILLFVAAVKQLPKISFHETAKQSLDLGVKSFSIVSFSQGWYFPYRWPVCLLNMEPLFPLAGL